MHPELLRPALALSVAAALTASGVAAAAPAPKPVCNLITDPTGDETVGSSNLDVVSADVASDDRRLTGVIRVAKLAGSDGTAPTGVAYNLRFQLPGDEAQYYLLASFEPAPVGTTTFEYGTIEAGNSLTPLGSGTGKVDLAKNEVRISAPTAFGGKRIRPGTVLRNLQALTQRRFVVLLTGADSSEVDAGRTYTAGAKSCVKPGA